jgi:hypothetical protein
MSTNYRWIVGNAFFFFLFLKEKKKKDTKTIKLFKTYSQFPSLKAHHVILFPLYILPTAIRGMLSLKMMRQF